MDALASEVAGLVEPVLLGTRLYDLDDRAHEGALRGRAPCREVEPRPLAGSLATETQHAHGHAHLERASPAGTGHLEKRGAGPADLRPKLAVVESVQADAAPPQAGHEKRNRQSDEAEATLSECAGGERDCHCPRKSDDDARTARELPRPTHSAAARR